ncbi:hypothetical protein L7F22_067203 [Adiantum nelumboides]|nr:hypothetical protein [Adiantum nelumboides]
MIAATRYQASSTFYMQVMAPDASAHLNLTPPQALRNPSSDFGNSDDSDFEFDHFSEAYSDEPPASPKLKTSPDWRHAASASMVSATHFSANHIYTAAGRNVHYVNVIDAVQQGFDGTEGDSDTTIKRLHKAYGDAAISNTKQQILTKNGGGLTGASAENVHGGVISTGDDQRQKVRVSLRSLMLERREREQLPSITSTFRSNVKDDATPDQSKMSPRRSSPSRSSSASADESASSISSQRHLTKKCCKRWSLMKLDFLQARKGSPSTSVDDHHHHHSEQHAVAMTIDEESESEYHDVAEVRDHEYCGTCSSSLSSMSSRGSSAMKPEKDVRAQRKNKNASAPVSPTASPARASASMSHAKPGAAAHLAVYGDGRRPASPATPSGVKGAMSPHAQHYRQQRARAEEMRRRTSLPYRQSLFGTCFFLPSRPDQVAC